MHQVLLITELLEAIFQHVEDKVTYAQLARTCQCFKKLALDGLYSDIPSFPQFLKCTSPDLWLMENSYTIGFQRDFRQDDWDKLFFYAKRVKSVVINNNISSIIVSNSVAITLRKCPFPSLFPQLHTLRIHGYKDVVPIHRVLMVPTLRSLYARNMEVFSFLTLSDNPLALCPMIEHFSCDYFGRELTESIMAKMLDTFSSWKRLRSVDCGSLDARVLEHLATMPQISSLVLTATTSDLWLGKQIGIPNCGELKVRVDNFDTFSRAMYALFTPHRDPEPFRKAIEAHSPAHLSSMTVSVFRLYNPTQRAATSSSAYSMSLITSALASCVTHDHLTIIKLSDYWSSDRPSGRVKHVDLKPLCIFTQLTVLVIKFQQQRIMLDDDHLADLLVHWPRLKTLCLTKLERPMGMSSLLAVLRACPELRNLDVAFRVSLADAEVLRAPPSESDERNLVDGIGYGSELPCNRYIEWMNIEHATENPEDAAPLAGLFQRILPALCSCQRAISSTTGAASAHEARRWMEQTRRWPNGRLEEAKEWRAMFWSLVFAEMRGETLPEGNPSVSLLAGQFRGLLGYRRG